MTENKLKISIKDESNTLICKIGTFIDPPLNKTEYSYKELSIILRNFADLIEDYD